MLTVAFYESQPDDPIINKITTRLTGGRFAHVELFFSAGSQALEIYQGKKAIFRKKQFGRSTWKFVRIQDVSYDDQKKAFVFASKNIVGKRFNFAGFLRCISPFPQINESKDSFFCSEAITTILKHIGIIPESVISSTVTPTDLYSILKEQNTINVTNPLLRTRLKDSRNKLNTKAVYDNL